MQITVRQGKRRATSSAKGGVSRPSAAVNIINVRAAGLATEQLRATLRGFIISNNTTWQDEIFSCILVAFASVCVSVCLCVCVSVCVSYTICPNLSTR